MNEGLILHPDNEHLIFPLGTTIVVRHIISRTQQFLCGHDNDISVIVVSNTGKYIASGQKTYQGFQVSAALNLNCPDPTGRCAGGHHHLGLRHP